MILGPHILVATVASKYFSDNLYLVFIISITSHFLTDMLPHWDYHPSSIIREKDSSGILLPRFDKFNFKNYSSDFFKFLVDGLSGVLVAMLFLPDQTSDSFLFLAVATMGGILPDLLQGFYSTGKFNFLKPLQVFHAKIHWWKKYAGLEKYGLATEILIVFAFLVIGSML